MANQDPNPGDHDPNHGDHPDHGNVFRCPHCGHPIPKAELPVNKKKKKKQKSKSVSSPSAAPLANL